MSKLIALMTCMALGVNIVTVKASQPFEATTIEERASACELSVEEFKLFSGIVEAESNRSTDGDLEGRIMIALTIWNRVHDSRFPDSVTGVISQSGQFSTYRRSTGSSCVSGTVYSDEAVIRAYEWIESGEEYPWVLFFNCRYYFSGYTAYDCIGGNYFSVAEPMIEEAENE